MDRGPALAAATAALIVAQKQMDLAFVYAEVAIAQSGDSAESLRNVFKAEQFQTCMLAQRERFPHQILRCSG